MPTISFCERYPVIDILPVIKGAYFSEDRKLLYYTRTAYIRDEGFLYDLVKFERDPAVKDRNRISESDSIAAVSFNYTGITGEPVVTILLNADGNNRVYNDDREFTGFGKAVTYRGVDEQGWYWGVSFLLPEEYLRKIYGSFKIIPGDCITGNIYACSLGNEGRHFVSVAPFINQDILCKKNHSAFRLLQ